MGERVKKSQGRSARRERMRWRRSTRLVGQKQRLWEQDAGCKTERRIGCRSTQRQRLRWTKRERQNEREEKTYPWRFMRYKGGERLCALCLEPCRACSQRQSGCLNRLEGSSSQVATTAELWATSGERASHGSQQQHRTDLAWNGLQYQQVAIGQLEGGGSTMEAHGMLSSLVVRRGKRTRALVGGEQATNERAERLKAAWGGCRSKL
ncbi:hypothetical protein GGI43DRAFT_66858 [Trichoderma evansii]